MWEFARDESLRHEPRAARAREWDDYIELFERIERRLGDETFFRLAHGYSEAYPEFRAFAGAVISPARFARVLALLAQGRSNKEIAAALGGSVRTIELHVSRVIAKSGCTSRAEVSAAYWRRGEVD